LRRAANIVSLLLLLITLAGVTTWMALAVWFRLPAPVGLRGLVAVLLALLGLMSVVGVLGRQRFVALATVGMVFAGVLIWWSTIRPAHRADWAPDVAQQFTGRLDGDKLTLTNVRSFAWRSDSDFTQRWETQTYDLGELQTLDLFMSYWGGRAMAHVMMSFGFRGNRYLTLSVEVRRLKDGEFSPVRDLFKANPLVIVAATEPDVVGVRSNIRGEDVQLYRLRTAPQMARSLLLEYVENANALAREPAFYNSLTTNCALTVVKMMRAVGATLPLDWRLVFDGYLPEYAYAHGALDTRFSIEDLRQLAHIVKRAREAGLTSDYSQAIRVGVPSPHSP